MSVGTQEAGARTEQETFSFQAEVVQLLDLMVNSLYSNKEIFLRELISNASDAIDRLRVELLSRGEIPEEEGPLQIRVSYDEGAGTITIADNGIGMSRQEVIDNIGTIAKSGTREFLRALSGDQRKDLTLIGQFGVGFYSAFIVAERVILNTRRADLPSGEGVRWESDGRGEYTLQAAECPTRGTTIVLQLRDGEDDLLNSHRLRSIIQKYSDHISLPIVMPEEKAEVPEDAKPAEEAAAVNQASALWTRPKSELTEADYRGFYRHVASDFSDPLAWVHSKVEGTYEYTLLLFIPARAPFDMWIPQPGNGVRLHIRRVFVLQDNGQLMPQYLRFVRGVIDSSDLPLNISRELLQSSRVVDHIRSNAVKKVLRLLGELAENEPEKYAIFWKEFGTTLKEGITDDYSNRDEIAKLLRFTSTKSATEDADVSFRDYVSRMKENQEHIYYLLAPSLAAAIASPHLEAFKKKGVEVLLLSEDVDNWVLSNLREFEGKRLQSVAQGTAGLGPLEDEEEARVKEAANTVLSGLVSQLKAILAGRAWDVRVSSRLTTSPACIVADEPENENSLAHRLRGSGLPMQPVLEINPGHPLIQRLNREPADPQLAEWAHVLFNQAILTLGARIEEPGDFVSRLNDLLVILTDQVDVPVPSGPQGILTAAFMDILRFATAGSVDDGKSTLIGRLLYDSKAIFEDQLAAVERTSRDRGEEVTNLALLTDGLRAEREQGITIDVAYRYFATPRRKFIIADTPGHIQYTRNMVTGASTADLAIVLVDARKGLTEQSRRHAFLTTLLRVPHLVLAVNKMDLVDFDGSVFDRITKEFAAFATRLEIADLTCVPVSALHGDNVVERSANMPWYDGPPLLRHLEHVHVASDRNLIDARFPVQYVIRPHQATDPGLHDYRGYAGQMAGGVLRPGDEVLHLPSGFTTTIRAMESAGAPVPEAFPPMSVTLRLDDDIDISRGDLICRPHNRPDCVQDIEAMVCWMSADQVLAPRARLLVKHTTTMVKSVVTDLHYRIDVNTLHRDEGADWLGINEIGRVRFRLTRPIFADPYARNRTTGGFILIDEATSATVGAAMITGAR